MGGCRYRPIAYACKPVRWIYNGGKTLTSGYGISALNAPKRINGNRATIPIHRAGPTKGTT
ncbi:hypothetical protein Ait01nite_088220 [Actinoplanes italicus]|nr:hypothetical protein Ait01nite_088220 [Actinoplanes italicus]